mgnify:CR=1 FL=1
MNSSIFQKKKVVRIEENGRCHLIDWTPGDKIDGINTDHENLMGLEHKGLKLGMFGLEWFDSTRSDAISIPSTRFRPLFFAL